MADRHPPAGSAEASPPADHKAGDKEGYRQALQAALAEVEGGRQDAPGRAAARLRSLDPVALSDGTTVRPDVAAVVAGLEAQPTDLVGAKTGLRALLAELDRARTAPGGSWGADPRDSLRRILERPEFRPEPEPDPITSFLRQVQRGAMEWISSAVSALGRWLSEQWQRAGIGDLQPLPQLLGLLLVVGLLAWVLRALRRATVGTPARAPAERVAAPTSGGVRAEALRLAERGDFRGAVRALYLAALLRWDERGWLRFDRALTNREMLARARGEANPALAERLAPLVGRFDRLWYGGASCSPEDYADFARLAEAATED